MDKRDMAEIINRLNNKSTISSGCIFEMFGVKYVAITDKSTNPCEKCAFEECNCMFNVDIPSCNNDVHFEVIKDIKFGLFGRCSAGFDFHIVNEHEAFFIQTNLNSGRFCTFSENVIEFDFFPFRGLGEVYCQIFQALFAVKVEKKHTAAVWSFILK